MNGQRSPTAIPWTAVRIVFCALAAGVGLLLAVSLSGIVPLERSDGLRRQMLWVLAAAAFVTIPAGLVLPGVIARRVAGRREAAQAELDAGQLPSELFAGPLVGAAMFEGFGLLGALTHLLTGHVVGAGAAGLAVLLILLRMPSEGWARARLEDAAASG